MRVPVLGDHGREILPRVALEKRLDPVSRYLDLLEADAEALELVAVSALVNNVKNDGPELVTPLNGGYRTRRCQRFTDGVEAVRS